MFDAEGFLSGHSLAFRRKGVNVPKDAVNVCCIYCGERRFHLAIRKNKHYVNCWVCHKYVPTAEFVKDVAKCSWAEARQIVYGARAGLFMHTETCTRPIRAEVCRLPKGCERVYSAEKRKPNILYWDIETSLMTVPGMRKDWINGTKREYYLMELFGI